jgi:hypothetical protein
MAVSGSKNFELDVAEYIEEAFERCGLKESSRKNWHAQTIIRRRVSKSVKSRRRQGIF